MGLKVLSLFDGISCGRIALDRLGLNVEKYYASEINMDAIQCSKNNYNDIVHLGDINDWRSWDIDFSKIDLLIGGSPCQGFSFSGKQLNFEDPRSKLFFVYRDILDHIKTLNPNILFLLENVKMKKEYEEVITNELGVLPITINSALVSAQRRVRLYWTNIKNINQPADKKIMLKDIITEGYVEKDKSFCILEGESRPHADNYKRYLRYKNKSFVTIVYNTQDLNPHDNRVLNQTELERLQTLPEGYTKGFSRNKCASFIGNGWTVDVIVHILSFMGGYNENN
jgi:site-specific DNA-cytosine methylase